MLSEERAVSLPPGARYPDRMEALTPLAYDWRDAAADRELRKARLTGLPTPPVGAVAGGDRGGVADPPWLASFQPPASLRPSRPAAAQAAAQPPTRRRTVGMISGLIRLRAADGDDDDATIGELDVGPAESRCGRMCSPLPPFRV